jgi:hypothetical protein
MQHRLLLAASAALVFTPPAHAINVNDFIGFCAPIPARLEILGPWKQSEGDMRGLSTVKWIAKHPLTEGKRAQNIARFSDALPTHP